MCDRVSSSRRRAIGSHDANFYDNFCFRTSINSSIEEVLVGLREQKSWKAYFG